MATKDRAVKKAQAGGLHFPQIRLPSFRAPAPKAATKPAAAPAPAPQPVKAKPRAPKAERDYLAAARPFRRVGVIIPGSLVAYFEKQLRHAGIREDTRVWMGKRLLLSVCIGLMVLLVYLALYNPVATATTALTGIGLFAAGFLATAIPLYLSLYFSIADRTATLEKVLPDFLLLTASNMRAGMSPFPAFLQAAKPEFGALYDEVILAMAKAGGATSLVDALAEISVYFDSGMLQRITLLFGKGLRSGGQLAKLLRSSADEIRRIQDLRDELSTATRSYTIFLGFIVVIVMPFLLSVSVHFLTVFLALQPTGSSAGLPANIPSFSGKVSITPDQMLYTAMITLAITSLLMSALVGIIGKGKALYGIKYFPIFLAGSIGFFFLAKTIIGTVLAGFGTVS
jgi:Flp pilus assembly protein TadB